MKQTRKAVVRAAQFVAVTILVLAGLNAFAGTYTSIETRAPWTTCGSCAARGGTGPGVSHGVNYSASSPSLDGRSTQFSINGGFPFANAIWWRQLGGTSASNFTYDLYFYITNPGASEALEFDVNQSIGGRKYIFGTQCGVNYDHQWDVWDPAGHTWRRTGIPCTNVRAFSWNHLTLQFYRSGGTVHYVSVTLNGAKSYINRAYNSISSGSYELNTAFQMDQTGSHTPYSVWLDHVSLTAW